jgi:hypothetical protein
LLESWQEKRCLQKNPRLGREELSGEKKIKNKVLKKQKYYSFIQV